jgi:ribosome-binding protein aMBF1 (putative translation factor)
MEPTKKPMPLTNTTQKTRQKVTQAKMADLQKNHPTYTLTHTLGLTQEALVEKIDTASTYIATIESERRTPSFKMIERIAEILKVDAPELFSTKDYPSESTSQLH